MAKRLNPYQYLLKDVREFCRKIKYAHTATMFFYPKKNIEKNGYTLDEVWARVSAAQQLGYEVIIESNIDGLYMIYRKKSHIFLVNGYDPR